MPSLYAYIALGGLILGLGWYAKEATERAVLAERATETLAQGYEGYENRIKAAQRAQERRDAAWKLREADYEKQISDLKRIPVTECDLAPVDNRIVKRLLSGSGYNTAGGGDTADTATTDTAPGPAPSLSNRGQSEWLTGYQRQLDMCNEQLVQIKQLVDEEKRDDN